MNKVEQVPIHGPSYTAGINDADAILGALWSDLFNKDLVKAEAADFFDRWRGRLRAKAAADSAPFRRADDEFVALVSTYLNKEQSVGFVREFNALRLKVTWG